jgi:hypothetical protein
MDRPAEADEHWQQALARYRELGICELDRL